MAQPSAPASLAVVILLATNIVVGLYALKAIRYASHDSSVIAGIVIADTIVLASFTLVYFIASRKWHHVIPAPIAAGFIVHSLIALILGVTSDRDAVCLLWHVSAIPPSVAVAVYIMSVIEHPLTTTTTTHK